MMWRTTMKVIQIGVIIGLVLAWLSAAVQPAYASPWTPMDWQDGGKLTGWVRDANGNYVDDLIDEIAAANPDQRVEIIVDFSRCLNDDLGARAFIETLGGGLVYESKFVTYAIFENVRAGDAASIGAYPGVSMVELSLSGEWQDVERQAMKVQSSTTYPNTLASRFGWHGTLNGTGVNIAIVDSGVDDSHADLTGSYLHGYNAMNSTYTNPPDDVGHGTYMARFALGSGNLGIAPDAGLIDIKVGDASHTPTSVTVAKALDVVLLKREAWNIKVVNLSFSWSTATDGRDALSQHVNRVAAAGILVVAAAGNGTAQGDPKIAPPGTASWAITVGAADPGTTVTRTDDTIANSTHGPRNSDGDSDLLDELKPDVATSSCCGTSPAAARTSGLAALLMQSKPNINPGSLKDLLIRTAEDRAGADTTVKYPKTTATWDKQWGFGYVDAYAAVDGLKGPDPPRTDLTFIGFGGQAHPASPGWLSPAIETQSQRNGKNPKVGVPDKIFARIENKGSNPAYNVPVSFGVYDYTAGVRQFYDVGTKVVPVINAGQKLEVALDWTPGPLQNGEHGCILVTINYGLDSDFANSSNVAQRNLQIKPASSPARFLFRVENPLTEPALIHLDVEDEGGWTWTLSDNDFTLHPWEDCARRVMLTAIPPAGARPGDQATFHVYAHATTESEFGDVIGGVTAQAYVPQPTAAFVYQDDDATAAEFTEVLAANDVDVTMMPLTEVAEADLSVYDLVLIGPDTGDGDAWGDDEIVQAINRSRASILALGTGGSAFLQQLGLTIGSASGEVSEGSALYVTDPDFSIYHTPNNLDVSAGSILTLFDSQTPVTYISLPDLRADVLALGRHPDDETLFPLVQQDVRYTAWNFDGPPSAMTTEGRDLFINVVHHTLTFAPGIDTLILTNYQRMQDVGYSSSSVSDLANKIYQLATLPPSQSKMTAIMRDLTMDAPDYVANAYTAWAGNESDIDKTNALVAAIRKYIKTLKTGSFYNLKYVILVGSHEVIPMEVRPIPIPWDSASETQWATDVLPQKSGYLYDIYHDTQGSARGHFLSDLIYRNWSHATNTWSGGGGPGYTGNPAQWIGEEYLPELSVGRLVETPDQIRGVLNAYVARQGNLSRLNMAVVASRDFTKAGGWAAKSMGATADTTLVRDCAGFAVNTGNCFPSSLVPPKLNAKHDVVFLGGHGSFNELTTQKWHYRFKAGSDPNQGDTAELNPMPGAVLVSGGSCHLGLNLGNKLYHAPDGTTTYADFPEEFAAKQAGVYIGATTITFGDCCAKKLEADFIDKLLNTGYKQTAGQAQLDAIKQYLVDHGPNTGFGGTAPHRQTLAASTFYGMPTYGWKAPLQLKKPFDFGVAQFCNDCPFSPTQEVITWHLENWTVMPDGLIQVEGATYGSGGVDLPLLPRVHHRRVLPRSSSVAGILWDEEASESVVIPNDVPLDTASWVNNTLDGVVTEGTGEFDYAGFYPPQPYEALSDSTPGGNAFEAGLTLAPVQYNPTTHETRIWTKLVFTVDYDVPIEDLDFDGDSDTLPDYWEAGHGLDRYDAEGDDGPDGDPDGDGLRNADELERGTDPLNPDSDLDGETDSAELEAGSDPLDPRSRGCMLDADFNDDRQTNIDDLQLIAERWRGVLGDLLYTLAYDANDDGQIDIRDVAWAAAQWGESCSE